MKTLKILLLSAFFLGSFVAINTSTASNKNLAFADLRVRVVPGCPDQKKKDAQHSTAPKPATTSTKSNNGFFCSETNAVKSKLAVVNGGAPK